MKTKFILLALLGAFSTLDGWAQTTTNSSLPEVTIRGYTTVASESGTNGSVVFARSGGTNTAPLKVYFSISGSASNGVDYAQIPKSIDVPAVYSASGNTNLLIVPIDDSIREATETVVLKLLPSESYRIGSLSNVTVSILDNDGTPPAIRLINPTNQAVFSSPTNILLEAEASTTNGYVAWVSFYAGATFLGSQKNYASNQTFAASLLWSNPPPAHYTLTAIGADNFETRATSAPVNITVLGQTNATLPVINVIAVDSSAAEGAVNGTSSGNTGTFKISRSGGNTNNPITVFFGLEGTAVNQVDYSGLANSITIPGGMLYANLVVQPIDDNLVEGTETVILNLRTNSAYALGTSRSATVSIQDNDFATNIPPSVSIVSPTNNSVFTAPANINLYVNAHDGDTGWVATVEFFAGTNSLGVVTNNPLAASPANPFYMKWTNVPPGDYTLTAKATDNNGASTVSSPVSIKVLSSNTPPATVTIMATDPEASESAANSSTTLNTATFTISRTGSTDVELRVYYTIGGSASNGVDYASIPDSIVLAAGAIRTNIVIRPFDDALVEPTESVVIGLNAPICAQVYPPPPGCYQVGNPAVAQAFIYDNDTVSNVPPAVRITSPTNNAVFYSPANIPISADASDGDGSITRVDFFAGDHLIGSDTSAPYSLIWSNVYAGSYSISAKATDNNGAFRWSEPVRVSVLYPTEVAFVKRVLPMWYVPGVKLTVQLRAEPKTNTLSYSVEDLPPTNWIVGAISEGGVLDTTDGKVKFAFNDGLRRTLTYEVTPPSNEKGEKHFVGSATANSITTPIVGQNVIVKAPPHPADKNPTNFVVSLDELNSYTAAWKRCERWIISPNPIPVSYVTRAGYLYANGGGYVFSTSTPTPFPPLLWVSTNAAPPTFDATTGSNVGEIPWTTNRFGTAVSALPTNYSVGVSFTVTITVTPSAGVAAYALEERPPFGWTVTNVSDNGVFCPMTGKIRWGVFLDNNSRPLSYTVTPTSTNAPAAAEFAGVASFDGINVPIVGVRRSYRAASTTPPARLESIKPLSDGNRLLTFLGDPGTCYVLEGTTNLVEWVQIENLLNNDGTLQYIDLATNEVQRFYRAMPKQ